MGTLPEKIKFEDLQDNNTLPAILERLNALEAVAKAAAAWHHMPDDWTLGDVGIMLVNDLGKAVSEYEALATAPTATGENGERG